MRPQTFTDVPSTRKPSSLQISGSVEPTSRGQTYAKFKKITRTRPSRARTRQSAALSGLGALKAGQWTWAKVPQGKNCRVDLRGKYANGQSADASNVDVCSDKTVDLTN